MCDCLVVAGNIYTVIRTGFKSVLCFVLNTKRGVEKVGLAETCTLAAVGCYGEYLIFTIRTMKRQSLLNCVLILTLYTLFP